MTTKQKKWRHELKYQINRLDDYSLSNKVKKIFKHDEHTNSHGIYRVNSLYFDSPFDHALKEKINGINEREKFRIRYYNDNTEMIRLEKKSKRDGVGTKSSTRLSKAEVQLIIEGHYHFLLQRDDALCFEFYTKLKSEQLRPKSVVVYEREAFTYGPGNTRITFDRNIQTTHSVHHFLDTQMKRFSLNHHLTILEIKYDHFLPDIVKMVLNINNRLLGSYSKYATSRYYE